MNRPAWKQKSLIGLALVGLLAVPLLAQMPAAGPGGDHHGMMKQHLHALTTQLGLTQDQIAATKQIAHDLMTQAQPIHEAQAALHTQLKAALDAPNPDPAAVGQLVISMHQNRQKAKPLFDEFDKKFSALLTPDQVTKYEALKQSHHGHFGGPFSGPPLGNQ
jgi:Spy/CpxP family protein refolding chaperone